MALLLDFPAGFFFFSGGAGVGVGAGAGVGVGTGAGVTSRGWTTFCASFFPLSGTAGEFGTGGMVLFFNGGGTGGATAEPGDES